MFLFERKDVEIFTTFTLIFCRYVTALHIAADKAHYDVMDVLLKHSAKVWYICRGKRSTLLIRVSILFYLLYINIALMLSLGYFCRWMHWMVWDKLPYIE